MGIKSCIVPLSLSNYRKIPFIVSISNHPHRCYYKSLNYNQGDTYRFSLAQEDSLAA